METKRESSWSWVSIAMFVLLTASVAQAAPCPPDEGDADRLVIISGIIQDPDPITLYWWDTIREQPFDDLSNGHLPRDAGPPTVAYDPETEWPIVFWSSQDGDSRIVAYSRWNGIKWDAPRYITVSAELEVDPQVIFSEEGLLHVVWQVDGSADSMIVHAVSANGGESWCDAFLIDSGDAEAVVQPSIVEHERVVRIAYAKTKNAPNLKEVRLIDSPRHGVYADQPPFEVDRAELLHPRLHAAEGFLWLDWRNDASYFAYSVYDDDEWEPRMLVPLTDPSAAGVYQARQFIYGVVVDSE